MRKLFTALLSSLLMLSCNPGTESVRMLVGTYTKDNDSQGVYLYDFNCNDATAVLIDTAKADNPSFIVAGADKKFAYSVGEYTHDGPKAYSYRITSSSIDVFNHQSANGAASGRACCHVLICNNRVYTSNYTGGSVSVFPILEDGSLAPLCSQLIPSKDEDPRPSHMHSATLSPDGRYIFIADLGHDAVYRVDADDSTLFLDSAICAYQFDTIAHPGPRHMCFSPDGTHAYLLHELSDELSTFKYSNGNLELQSTIMAYKGEGHGSADVHISGDGRFLYTSHRLKEDGISVFSIDGENGTPTAVSFQKTGIHPRNFAISPDGKYLLCACRDDNMIEIFEIDQNDGTLAKTGKNIYLPCPVCIHFF